MQWSSAGEKLELRGHGVTMRQILVWLSEQTHREIVDKTGMTEEAYDFEMSWTPDTSSEPNDSYAADVLDAAIEKYLGLKVVSRKTPVEMLVIDRLDRTPVERIKTRGKDRAGCNSRRCLPLARNSWWHSTSRLSPSAPSRSPWAPENGCQELTAELRAAKPP